MAQEHEIKPIRVSLTYPAEGVKLFNGSIETLPESDSFSLPFDSAIVGRDFIRTPQAFSYDALTRLQKTIDPLYRPKIETTPKEGDTPVVFIDSYSATTPYYRNALEYALSIAKENDIQTVYFGEIDPLSFFQEKPRIRRKQGTIQDLERKIQEISSPLH